MLSTYRRTELSGNQHHGKKLVKATFYFKIDKDDELCLIWASNLKGDPNEAPLAGDKNVLMTVPDHELGVLAQNFKLSKEELKERAYLAPTLSTQRNNAGSLVSLRNKCPFCQTTLSIEDEHEFLIKSILKLVDFYENNKDNLEMQMSHMKNQSVSFMKHYQFQDTTKALGSPSQIVPAPIQHLYPYMSYEKYIQKKKEAVWLYESARVCEACNEGIEQILNDIDSQNDHLK